MRLQYTKLRKESPVKKMMGNTPLILRSAALMFCVSLVLLIIMGIFVDSSAIKFAIFMFCMGYGFFGGIIAGALVIIAQRLESRSVAQHILDTNERGSFYDPTPRVAREPETVTLEELN